MAKIFIAKRTKIFADHDTKTVLIILLLPPFEQRESPSSHCRHSAKPPRFYPLKPVTSSAIGSFQRLSTAISSHEGKAVKTHF